MTPDQLRSWFVEEVLPLEGMLEAFLRRNWRQADEVPDLRQEVYARVFDGCAQSGLPESTRAYVLSAARNLLIDKVRRAQIVSIETYADIDEVLVAVEEVGPERVATARGEIRLLQAALALLPERCRQVIELRKIEELSQREVAARMGITEDTVERQVSKGVRALAAALQSTGLPDVNASPLPLWRRKGRTTP